MLILSIVLAAMAPVMTTRNKSDYSSPWRYSTNGSDAYFAGNAVSNQIAMLGQHEVGTGENDARLIIRTAADSGWSHLLFKSGDEIVGRLYLDKKNLFLSNSNPAGERNTGVGIGALQNNNSSGKDNTALGFYALQKSTSGSDNTAVGRALGLLTSGTNNVAVGNYALGNLNSGKRNTAVGYDCLRDIDGNDNIAIGYRANYDVSGIHNINNSIAIGASSKSFADGATAIGSSSTAEESNTISIGNEAHAGSIYNNTTTGLNSIAIGRESKANSDNTISIGNEAVAGNENLYYAPSEAGSIAIGNGATAYGQYKLAGTIYSGSIAIGESAKAVAAPVSIALGKGATLADGTVWGVAIGPDASAGGSRTVSGTTGGSNFSPIAIGYQSLAKGDSDIAIGESAKARGSYSIALGTGANTDEEKGQASVAIGYLSESVGKHSIAIGSGDISSDSPNPTSSTGDYSIALGYQTESANSKSIAIGYQSESQSEKSITIGNGSICRGVDSVCIGNGVKGGEYPTNVGAPESPDHVIHLGTSSDTVYIPGNLVVMGDTLLGGTPDRRTVIREKGDGTSFLQIWGSEGDPTFIYTHSSVWEGPIDVGPFTIYKFSDRRLKYVGKENTSGLDKIRQLKVFNYTFKKDEKKTPHVGVIAQDLQKVFPDAVKKGVDGFLTIRMEDMFYAVINAIKELDSRVTALEKENQELKARIERLESKLK